MWTPADIEQFQAAVESGALEEKHDFDAKRQLPDNNKELAKDIAAMTTDGGLLVYGVGEDANGQPRVLEPIELTGAAERIDQVAQHSVSGNPRIECVVLRIPEDEGRGYLLVVIPASPYAPHQVTVGNDRRFYGRGDTGNRRLSEEEVARLYERRRQQSVDREDLLSDCIAQSPLGSPTSGETGFLQAFVQPALPDDELWDRAVATRDSEQAFLEELRAAVGSVVTRWGGTDLSGAYHWARRGAEKWSLDTANGRNVGPLPARNVARVDLGMDGRSYLFYGGGAEIHIREGADPVFFLYERGIALVLAQFLTLIGAYYKAGGQYGPIDIGMAVTGIRGAISAHLHDARAFSNLPYADEDARRTERCDTRDLCENPLGLSRRLLSRLMRAIYGEDFDPLAVE